jgi:AcrR family transcriptional regulator
MINLENVQRTEMRNCRLRDKLPGNASEGGELDLVQEIRNKNDLRIKKTYKLLTTSLFELLEKKPFSDITVIDICENAMVNRGTFYKHFEDKYHLLAYCIREMQREFSEQSIVDNSLNDPKDYYVTIIKNVLDYICDNRKMLLLILSEASGSAISEMFHRLLAEDIVQKLTDVEKQTGMVNLIPIPFIAEFYSGALISSIKWWIVSDTPYTRENIAEYIETMIEANMKAVLSSM